MPAAVRLARLLDFCAVLVLIAIRSASQKCAVGLVKDQLVYHAVRRGTKLDAKTFEFGDTKDAALIRPQPVCRLAGRRQQKLLVGVLSHDMDHGSMTETAGA